MAGNNQPLAQNGRTQGTIEERLAELPTHLARPRVDCRDSVGYAGDDKRGAAALVFVDAGSGIRRE